MWQRLQRRAQQHATPALVDILCRYPAPSDGKSRAARLMMMVDTALRASR
ncbi:hypothetical protein ACNUDN_18125 [Mycobacterium sp. smrl_JER01]